MRINSVRAFLTAAVNQSVGAVRRVGHAIGKRIRDLDPRVGGGVGVGDDESSFGGGRARVWFELFDEYRERVLQLFENSTFQRFPLLERILRRILGKPLVQKKAPQLPEKAGPTRLGAHVPERDPQSEALRAHVRQRMINAHQREGAGLRDEIAQHREENAVFLDPDEEGHHERDDEREEDLENQETVVTRTESS